MGLDKYSTSPTKYTDYLKKQAQDQLKAYQDNLPQQATADPGLSQLSDNMQQQFSQSLESLARQKQPVQSEVNQPQQSSILGAPTQVTQKFGNVNPGVEVFSHGGVNSGTDFSAPVGTTLALPQGQWKILQSFANDNNPGHIGDNTNSGYGNSVLVQNTKTGEKMRFSHLSKVNANPGDTLNGGTIIGATGNTGNVTGAHLDLEYYDQMGKLADILSSVYAQYLNMS